MSYLYGRRRITYPIMSHINDGNAKKTDYFVMYTKNELSSFLQIKIMHLKKMQRKLLVTKHYLFCFEVSACIIIALSQSHNG